MTIAPIEDSRQRGGTLTVDSFDFAKQITSCTLTPSEESEGDELETLNGATIEPDEVTSWELELGSVQDFVDPAGLVAFSHDNRGQVVAFSWTPNADGPTITGQLRVRALPLGGEVKVRLTSSKSWPIIGDPTITYPTV